MEYFAIFVPSADTADAEPLVFADKVNALKVFKIYKDARMKAFKNHGEAIKFAKSGINHVAPVPDAVLSSPPPNQPPMKSLERSNFPAPKSQELVKFRKEIEQNNVQKVYELINLNPRYLVSSGDTPSILKEGPRYNALHVAAINKHAKMAKLILQTVEQPEFIEHLHGFKNDPMVHEMSQFLLESYLNTPDKSRNDTPLHFAAKVGAVDVIEVLISYPLCKKKPNSEGKYPEDIICDRAPDTPADVKNKIEDLLRERYFVPVLRSADCSVQAQIGEPFTPGDMPKLNVDPLRPVIAIKAYVGPMTSEQAKSFRKRWKTPPRLVPSPATANINTSFSPKNSLTSSPCYSPRMSKSLTELISSTPKHKKKLFANSEDYEDEPPFIGDSNGNLKGITNEILGEHEVEFMEVFDDLMEDKFKLEKEKQKQLDLFSQYRTQETGEDTPIRKKHDSNSNHINQDFNSDWLLTNSNDSLFCNARSANSNAMMNYLDESGSIYNSGNIFNSPSFKEKHIRLADPEKGLEKIGRELATEQNFQWREWWDFLEKFIDIRSDEGLTSFENYLKRKESKLKEPIKSPKLNNFDAICAGLYSMDLNDELASKPNKITKSGLLSPSSSFIRQNSFSNLASPRNALQNLPLANPFICIEQSCRAVSKRLTSALESDSIQDQSSYEKLILQEINKLNNSIDNYMRDSRFNKINYKKVHARYSYLLVWYLKNNNVSVKYQRGSKTLISKVYSLASQFATPSSFDANRDYAKSHAMCLSSFISNFIEKEHKIFDPENVNTETACIDAWNGPDIVECNCSFAIDATSSKHRREFRKKLYQSTDMWALRQPEDSEDDESFLSCSDSENEEFFTPPSSPTSSDSEDIFEESLTSFEIKKDVTLFIEGSEPTQLDRHVFEALGENFLIDESKFQLVSQWFNQMKTISVKQASQSHKSNFRIFTPKLKKISFNS